MQRQQPKARTKVVRRSNVAIRSSSQRVRRFTPKLKSVAVNHPQQVQQKPIVQKKTNTDKLQFVHIPKTAGSTISESAYYQFGICWGMFDPQLQRAEIAVENKNKQRLYAKKPPVSRWHMPPRLFQAYCGSIKPYIKPKFCVVRNPYSRLVSEYEYEKSIKKTTHTDINHFIKDTLAMYHSNNYIYDGHLIPQYEYANACEYVLKFENLAMEFDDLMKQFNISLRLENLQRRKTGRTKCMTNTTNNVRTLQTQLNKESIKLINTFYQRDFIQFQYPMME